MESAFSHEIECSKLAVWGENAKDPPERGEAGTSPTAAKYCHEVGYKNKMIQKKG